METQAYLDSAAIAIKTCDCWKWDTAPGFTAVYPDGTEATFPFYDWGEFEAFWAKVNGEIETHMNEKRCPVCHRLYSEHPAISRKDNETEICPDCGVQEALDSYLSFINDVVRK